MLNKFKDMQRKKLEQLSEEKSQLAHKLISQQQYLLQLEQYQHSLSDVTEHYNAIALQNQHRMLVQTTKLVDFQQQQLALTKVDVSHQDLLIKQQYSRFKGLEILSDKKAVVAQKKKLQQEQVASDEISMLAFIRKT